MLKIRLYMFLEDETHDDNGYHIEKLYDRKCVNMFYPNPMVSPKENVIEILRQTFDKLCADIAMTIDSESKYDLKCIFDVNKLPYFMQKRNEEKENENNKY